MFRDWQVTIVMMSGQIFLAADVFGVWKYGVVWPRLECDHVWKAQSDVFLSENLPKGLWNSVNGMTGSQTDFHSSTTETCKDLQTQQDQTCSAELTSASSFNLYYIFHAMLPTKLNAVLFLYSFIFLLILYII